MPFVRISHSAGKTDQEIAALSAAVHDSLVETFNVPADDLFQVITAHEPGKGLRSAPSYLGITHTLDLVFVQIACSDGRTVEQKKALYQAIAQRAGAAGIRPEDVVINLIETKRENWSFGNGLAPYV